MSVFSRSLSAAILVSLVVGAADAQGRRKPKPPVSRSNTIVSVVLITSGNTAALQARHWTETLRRFDINFRIRSGRVSDMPGVVEVKQGQFRKVTVTGRLDRSGKLIFKDRVFKRSDGAKVGEWIRELKTYGSQGAPTGKPVWGLSKAQFGEVFRAMGSPVKKDVYGNSLPTALSGLGLPEDYPVRYSVDGKKAAAGVKQTVRTRVKGQSLGTALALVLREYGLGFRPLRTPRGTIELVIDPLVKARDAWPVGWDLKMSRPKTAPKMFEFVEVNLDKIKLSDLFRAVSVKTGVPIHVDHLATRVRGIDVDKLLFSYPRRKTGYSLLLRRATVPHKLTHKLRIDESGKPFVWVTVFGTKR